MDMALPRPRGAQRLKELLPLLRCPITGHSLTQPASAELVTPDGGHRWPIQDGRPCLYPGLEGITHHGEHLSNPICPEAWQVIEEAEGWVLNLSAGGTHQWHPRVVEAEVGIFRNTDVLADVHQLPFVDQAFDAVLALNAFEHYRDPPQAAREIARVLKPGGRVFIRTAFLQPLHEPPWHFYNATRFGVLGWFQDFDTEQIEVSENFNPVHTVAWLAAEIERMVRPHLGPDAADRVLETSLAEYARMWNDSASRDDVWESFFKIPAEAQESVAAGFQYLGRRR